MTAGLIAVAVVAVLVAVGALAIALRGGRTRTAADAKTAEIAQSSAALGEAQSEIMVRLKALAEAQTVGQSDLTRTLNERLGAVSKRMGERLETSAVKTAEGLGDLKKHLNVIDAAQKNIEELAGQVVGLQDILSNKQARGAFGEIQLNDIVRNVLPPSAYEMQATLSNGKRPDCLIKLPNPPGTIAIDAKFPLESYHALRNAADDAARNQAARKFRADILHHVTDIAAKYVVPGETAESALMFLPSEAVYAELHANFTEVVEKSYRLRVWIVSPTTMMATLNTVRAVLKDARMREQAGVIQKEVLIMLDNVRRLDGRVEKLQNHFAQTSEDVRQIRISTDKITLHSEKIEELQLEDGQAVEPDKVAAKGAAELPFAESPGAEPARRSGRQNVGENEPVALDDLARDRADAR